MYRGEKYPEMSTFPAPDGCNKCRCEGGQVTCSKTKCGKTILISIKRRVRFKKKKPGKFLNFKANISGIFSFQNKS